MSSVLHLYPSYPKTSLKNPTLFLKLLKSREDFCFQFGFLSSLPNHLKDHTDWGISVKIHGWKTNFVKVWIGSPQKQRQHGFHQNWRSMIFRTKKKWCEKLRFPKDPGTCRLVWADFCWQNASLSKVGICGKKPTDLGENGKGISDCF